MRRKPGLPSRPGMDLDPKPGFFRTKLVRGGPWVPARIYKGGGIHKGDDGLVFEVRGDTVPPDEVTGEPKGWPWHPLTPDEYKRLVSRIVQAHDRDDIEDPDLNPTKPVDLDNRKAIRP